MFFPFQIMRAFSIGHTCIFSTLVSLSQFVLRFNVRNVAVYTIFVDPTLYLYQCPPHYYCAVIGSSYLHQFLPLQSVTGNIGHFLYIPAQRINDPVFDTHFDISHSAILLFIWVKSEVTISYHTWVGLGSFSLTPAPSQLHSKSVDLFGFCPSRISVSVLSQHLVPCPCNLYQIALQKPGSFVYPTTAICMTRLQCPYSSL